MNRKTTDQPTDTGASRREFFVDVGMVIALAAAGVATVVNGIRFLMPEWRPPRMIDLKVADVDELSNGQAKELPNLQGHRVILVRTARGYRALSATCTHLGCSVKYEHDKQRLLCPCHQGVFDLEGKVVSGPPPTPLRQYPVRVAQGAVYVKVDLPAA